MGIQRLVQVFAGGFGVPGILDGHRGNSDLVLVENFRWLHIFYDTLPAQLPPAGVTSSIYSTVLPNYMTVGFTSCTFLAITRFHLFDVWPYEDTLSLNKTLQMCCSQSPVSDPDPLYARRPHTSGRILGPISVGMASIVKRSTRHATYTSTLCLPFTVSPSPLDVIIRGLMYHLSYSRRVQVICFVRKSLQPITP